VFWAVVVPVQSTVALLTGEVGVHAACAWVSIANGATVSVKANR
jgi:hypothetical protein